MADLQNIRYLKKYDFVKNVTIKRNKESEIEFCFTSFNK